jgi:hypothetical protein
VPPFALRVVLFEDGSFALDSTASARCFRAQSCTTISRGLQREFFAGVDRPFRSQMQLDEDVALSEGFWRELFLLPADKSRLLEILEPFTADDFLHIQVRTSSYFVSLDAFVAHHLVTNKRILPQGHR